MTRIVSSDGLVGVMEKKLQIVDDSLIKAEHGTSLNDSNKIKNTCQKGSRSNIADKVTFSS